MVSVCFVTNELYPLKPGGIGRLMYNFAIDNLEAPSPTDLHYLLPADARDQADAIREAYADLATVHFCSDELSSLGEFGQYLRQLGDSGDPDVPRSSNLDEHFLKSLKYYSGLLAAQAAAGIEFDIIEFPDFGGWAVAAQAAKKAGLAFTNTVIAVRLHSTFGLITLAERYYHRPSLWLSAIWDMERMTMQDADLVVGHLESIAGCPIRGDQRCSRNFHRSRSTNRSAVQIGWPPVGRRRTSSFHRACSRSNAPTPLSAPPYDCFATTLDARACSTSPPMDGIRPISSGWKGWCRPN
jgi:hypothetical protein